MPVINRSSFILPLSGVRLRRETPPKNQQSAPVSENSRPSPCSVWGIPHCPSIPAHEPLFIAASCVNERLERQPNTTRHDTSATDWLVALISSHIHTAPIPYRFIEIWISTQWIPLENFNLLRLLYLCSSLMPNLGSYETAWFKLLSCY